MRVLDAEPRSVVRWCTMATDEAAKKLQALTIINAALSSENEAVRGLACLRRALLTLLHLPAATGA